MSEAEPVGDTTGITKIEGTAGEDLPPGAVEFKSFAERVYATFKLIDVTPHIAKKGQLDYLPWAPAWRFVLETFPESTYKYKKPKIFPSGYGEQWVTVKIIEGDNVYTRKWWLPFLDHRNQPVKEPTSLQINNTRMRVLVKCLAMCGLGTELYAGEDVPDQGHDARDETAKDSTLPPEQIFEGRGHIDTIKDAVPVDALEIKGGKIMGFDREAVDLEALEDLLIGDTFNGKADLKMWVFENIHPLQNRFLRNYEKKRSKELNEQAKAEE